MFEEYGHWRISNWNQTMYSKNNDNVIRAMIIMWQHDERYKYVELKPRHTLRGKQESQ